MTEQCKSCAEFLALGTAQVEALHHLAQAISHQAEATDRLLAYLVESEAPESEAPRATYLSGAPR